MIQKLEKKVWAAVLMALFLAVVSGLAYLRYIPTQIKAIPYYDSIGHFMLFGIFAFLAELAWSGVRRRVLGFEVPLGATLVVLYAVADEFLQILSSSRTFDLKDLGFGLLGIAVFSFVARSIRK